MRISILASAAFAATLSSAFASAQTAPLPPHWTAESEPEDEGAAPPRALRGVYGRGISDPAPQTPEDFERNGTRPICQGDAAAQRAWLGLVGETLTEFWFYATRNQAVLFRRTILLPSPGSCSERPAFSYHVERGLIADGMFHEIEETDEATRLDTRHIGSREPDLSGGFGPFYAMATRDMRPPQGRSSTRRIAGTSARCSTSGFGYIWGEVCVSRAGPSRGLPLLLLTQDDSQILYSTEFRELMSDAALDPRLFELHRLWRAPQR